MTTNKVDTNLIQALAISEKGGKLEPFAYKAKECGPWDIEVKISHCGICHSDLHLMDNDWKVTHYPLVPGHEIIGIITKKGSNVNELSIGSRVGIGWQCDSCQKCEWCHCGEDNLCLKQTATCVDHYGGFADRIVTDSRFAFSLPEALDSVHAAPLLCGGATVFSPFMQHQINGTHKVGVIGIGGLGHLALQFAHAFGCTVYAFSSSNNKQKEAIDLGAHHFISLKDAPYLKKLASSLDFLFVTTSHAIDIEQYLSLLRPKGKLIIIGAPTQELAFTPLSLISASKGIVGSNIASSTNIKKMLAFAALHNIQAQIKLFPMKDANKAIEKLRANQLHYRAVLTNEPIK